MDVANMSDMPACLNLSMPSFKHPDEKSSEGNSQYCKIRHGIHLTSTGLRGTMKGTSLNGFAQRTFKVKHFLTIWRVVRNRFFVSHLQRVPLQCLRWIVSAESICKGQINKNLYASQELINIFDDAFYCDDARITTQICSSVILHLHPKEAYPILSRDHSWSSVAQCWISFRLETAKRWWLQSKAHFVWSGTRLSKPSCSHTEVAASGNVAVVKWWLPCKPEKISNIGNSVQYKGSNRACIEEWWFYLLTAQLFLSQLARLRERLGESGHHRISKSAGKSLHRVVILKDEPTEVGKQRMTLGRGDLHFQGSGAAFLISSIKSLKV